MRSKEDSVLNCPNENVLDSARDQFLLRLMIWEMEELACGIVTDGILVEEM